jgi:hypothetical protein
MSGLGGKGVRREKATPAELAKRLCSCAALLKIVRHNVAFKEIETGSSKLARSIEDIEIAIDGIVAVSDHIVVGEVARLTAREQLALADVHLEAARRCERKPIRPS